MGRFRKKKHNASMNITSLMDVLTIMLLFLLKNYSADGSILTNADNLVLPNSESKKKPTEVNLQIAVTQDMILLDNQAVVPTEDARNISQEENDPIITKLEERLKVCLAQEEEMVRLGALNAVQGRVIVQVDKNIDFDVLFKIMNTCGKSGYNNMNFAVMERDDG
ncbi:MAG: biopolymer transporter ExbD [Chitinispirillia bacterium]|nr:biopolymer transporter ExbD [Chitinispirillia bacterium]MCL2267960.1 biopolymer transporter ExbD [Chitinispirillia bacterium]